MDIKYEIKSVTETEAVIYITNQEETLGCALKIDKKTLDDKEGLNRWLDAVKLSMKDITKQENK
jgi:hypothetical protein